MRSTKHALLTVFRRAGAVLLPVALLLTSAPVVAAGNVTTFDIFIGETCVFGQTLPNKAFLLKVKNPDGNLKGSAYANSSEDGFWFACIEAPIGIGDRVSLQGSGADRTFVIPLVSIEAERVSNTVSGRAPAGATVIVGVDSCHKYDFSDCHNAGKEVVAVGGSYSATFNAINPRGQDSALLDYNLATGDHVGISTIFQFLGINLGSDFNFAQGTFDGFATEGTTVNVDLKTSGVVRGSGQAIAGPDFAYYGRFRNGAGDPVYPRAGDKVVSDVASNATMTIPAVGLNANAATDRVSGKCFPGQPVIVEAFDPDEFEPREHGYSNRFGVAGANGSFSFKMNVGDTDPDFDLLGGDKIVMRCKNQAGDEIRQSISVGETLLAPALVQGDEAGFDYSVFFGYNGSFNATDRGLVAANKHNGSVNHDPTCAFAPNGPGTKFFNISVPAGTTLARFQLFAEETDGEYDLDLFVLKGGQFVGQSTRRASEESVDVWNPDPGTYKVWVHGCDTGGVTAHFTLFSWNVGDSSAGNMTVTAPANAHKNGMGSVDLSFSGLAADTKYLGTVSYSGHSGMPNPTVVLVETGP